MIIYEDERFYILDTGSSNGTFVNNIRLSKTGEESKMTEVFTGDIIRFGSDIVDKSRQVTQKCIVTKLKLYDADGNLSPTRPSESRLFRPTDSFEDLSTITMGLQEALAREKMLEDKLITVKNMINKNIGRSQTDLIRLFENVREELLNLYDQRETIVANSKDDSAIDKLGTENHNLKKELKQLEQTVETKDQELDVLQKKTQADSVELMTLRRACQIQKDDLYKFELKLESSMEQLEQLQTAVQDAKDEVTKEFQEKITERENEMEQEKQIMKDRLHEVLSNEANLLNRIKSLESDEGYGRAEVDKALAKEREISELNQHLQYNVECLDRELQNALQVIETQKGQVKVVRDENDLAKIAEQEESIDNLQQELGYVKKELIEARANKSASDDKLSHVQDKIETMQNNINSLSDEGKIFNLFLLKYQHTIAIYKKLYFFIGTRFKKSYYQFRRIIGNKNHRSPTSYRTGGQNGILLF